LVSLAQDSGHPPSSGAASQKWHLPSSPSEDERLERRRWLRFGTNLSRFLNWCHFETYCASSHTYSLEFICNPRPNTHGALKVIQGHHRGQKRESPNVLIPAQGECGGALPTACFPFWKQCPLCHLFRACVSHEVFMPDVGDVIVQNDPKFGPGS
jgi:hypothetical protein